ncbi:hypothetical protein [Fimbriiglobus ruber]|uniref:Flagellar hook-length control protein FliK n=1 Tax=Fimbriiglobus ruber TaxID=1908690 RepID=A0A225DVF6_9BACT|nr:hypothetical protein [Fimbriiglobus ruber]OWK44983.1 Flagellar hook-length control protein FliK [Fimbriiglobus ruber]
MNVFDRQATDPWGTPQGPSQALLADGAWGGSSVPGSAVQGTWTFSLQVAPNAPVQITLFVGDQYNQWPPMNLYLNGQLYTGQIVPTGAGQFTAFQIPHYTQNNTTTLTISVQQPLAQSFWVLNGIDVRPLQLVAPLTVARYDGAANTTPQAADGATLDPYYVTQAQPGELLTVATTAGSIAYGWNATTNMWVADADPALNGFQVVADASGHAAFLVQRPTGAAPGVVSVRGAYGESSTDALNSGGTLQATASGDWTQTYQLPTTREVNFGPAGSPSYSTAAPAVTEGTAASDVGLPALPTLPPVVPYVLATPTALYGSGATGLGWITAPVGGFDRGANATPANDPYQLLRDGVYGTEPTAGDFEIDVPAGSGSFYLTLTLGDPASSLGSVTVGIDSGFGTLVASTDPTLGSTTVSIPAFQSVTVTFLVTPNAAGQIRFSIAAGASEFWALQALELHPAADTPRNLLTFTATSSAVADGTTPVTYTVTGATPGSFVTVGTSLGTVSSPDANPSYAGAQVVADGTGTATFTVTPPASGVAETANVWAYETTAPVGTTAEIRAGSTTQAYTPGAPAGATPGRYDFNGPGTDTVTAPGANTAAGFTGVRGSTLYTTTAGYGWVNPVGEFERTETSGADTALFEDGAWGFWTTGDFRISAPAGSTVSVRVYVGDSYNGWTDTTVAVTGNPTPVVLNPLTDQYLSAVLTGTADANGYFDVTIWNPLTGIWVLNGLDVAAGGPGNLPAPAAGAVGPEVAGAVGGAAPGALAVLTQPALDQAKAAAIGLWAQAGATPAQLAVLAATPVVVGNLTAQGDLGYTYATGIVIDRTGAGLGWFDDPASLSGAAVVTGGYDLLTVVAHELGHELGLPDEAPAAAGNDVMNSVLPADVRRVPTAADVAATGVATPTTGGSPATLVTPTGTVTISAPLPAATGAAAAGATAYEEEAPILLTLADPVGAAAVLPAAGPSVRTGWAPAGSKSAAGSDDLDALLGVSVG